MKHRYSFNRNKQEQDIKDEIDNNRNNHIHKTRKTPNQIQAKTTQKLTEAIQNAVDEDGGDGDIQNIIKYSLYQFRFVIFVFT